MNYVWVVLLSEDIEPYELHAVFADEEAAREYANSLEKKLNENKEPYEAPARACVEKHEVRKGLE